MSKSVLDFRVVFIFSFVCFHLSIRVMLLLIVVVTMAMCVCAGWEEEEGMKSNKT